MILRSRDYERKPPSKDATLFVIYCEGNRREPHYFRYFREISSRINIEIIEAETQGNNSPLGLYDRACSDVDILENEASAKYELGDGDQVWFVIDTDEWGKSIRELKDRCETRFNWFVAQSNPCFEIWLYYHFFSHPAQDEHLNTCAEWKKHVNQAIPGGFDSRKHPIHIKHAMKNAERHFVLTDGDVSNGSTEMFKLAKEIYPLVASVIEKARESEHF
jgi:hypothetical protein